MVVCILDTTSSRFFVDELTLGHHHHLWFQTHSLSFFLHGFVVVVVDGHGQTSANFQLSFCMILCSWWWASINSAADFNLSFCMLWPMNSWTLLISDSCSAFCDNEWFMGSANFRLLFCILWQWMISWTPLIPNSVFLHVMAMNDSWTLPCCCKTLFLHIVTIISWTSLPISDSC